jgi:hypothetical protein
MLPDHDFLWYLECPDSIWDDENRGTGHPCVRALNPRRHFVSDIANHHANGGVVIAIVTEARPNKMYELRVRNALKRKSSCSPKGDRRCQVSKTTGRSFLSYS